MTFDRDTYQKLENLLNSNELININVNDTRMGYGLYIKSLKKKEYDHVIKDPQKLSMFIVFKQKQHQADYRDGDEGKIGDIVTYE